MQSAGRQAGSVRLAILDDNPFVRVAPDDIRPRAALFHRFAEAVVEAAGLPPARYLVPVEDLRQGSPPPDLGSIDQRWLEVVPTRPFRGIAGYVRASPGIERRNWPVIRDAVAEADLLWIKAPASNALLAAMAARRAGVPRFTWIAGSARGVVRGQARAGASGVAAAVAAAAYDGVTSALARSAPAIRLDELQFTSVVTAADVASTIAAAAAAPGSGGPPWPTEDGRPLELAWAGRIARDKGLDDLLEACAILQERGRMVDLTIVGDGPDRARLEQLARDLQLSGHVTWAGYLADRGDYFARLRAADIFVLPSHAEGLPKVVVEAMAAGLPVIATSVGAVPGLLNDGRRGRLVRAGSPGDLAAAIEALGSDHVGREVLSAAGLAFAGAHTVEDQAARLLSWLRDTFPGLPWTSGAGS